MNAVLVLSVVFMLQGLPVPLTSTTFLPWKDMASCEEWVATPDQVGVSITGSDLLQYGFKCITKDEMDTLEKSWQAEPPMGPPTPKTSPSRLRNS